MFVIIFSATGTPFTSLSAPSPRTVSSNLNPPWKRYKVARSEANLVTLSLGGLYDPLLHVTLDGALQHPA